MLIVGPTVIFVGLSWRGPLVFLAKDTLVASLLTADWSRGPSIIHPLPLAANWLRGLSLTQLCPLPLIGHTARLQWP